MLKEYSEYAEFDGDTYFSCFRLKIPFWENLIQKNKNYLHRLKFGIESNSNVLNMMIMFTIFVLEWKHLCFGKFGSKIQICLIKVKFGRETY